jgi:signal transduction histidine kinase
VYRPLAKPNVRVLLEYDAAVPETLFGDPTRLRQVLSNLLCNAVKFTAEGRVTLRVRKFDGTISG